MGFSEEDEDGSDSTMDMSPDGGRVEEIDVTDDEEDEETQRIPNSPDVRSHEFELTVPLCDTAPIEEETQKVEDSDWEEEMRTQLVLDESDGEATDGTEVLSDNEVGFEDETCRIVGDDDSVSLEDKKDSNGVGGKAENGVSVTDSGASNGQCPSSGSARRSFMSIRAASLRASGRAAAKKMTASGTLNGHDSISHKSYSGNAMDEIISTAVIDTQRTEVVESDDNSNENRIVNQFGGKSHGIGGRATARKLFTEDTSAGSVSLYKNENSCGGVGEAEFRVCDPNLAGLSYLDSQEPGLLSQENAINVVENFLSNNDVELSHELNPKKTTKEKSPPISSVKGLKTVAQQANCRSPVNGVGMFDWNDAREDEGGGEFFSKNKEALFGSNYRSKRYFSQPQKSRQLKFKNDADTPEKPKRKKAGQNLRQKMSRLTRSDSRIALNNSKTDKKIADVFKTKSTNNLFDKLDEKLNPESSEHLLRENGVSNIEADICDIGIGTQMAAEAMEALACGFHAYVNASDATEVCNGNAMKDAGSKDDLAQKRTSNTKGTLCLSKRRKRVHDDREGVPAPSTSRKVLRSQTKDLHPNSTVVTTKKNAKAKVEENLNAVYGEVKSGRRSSKRIEGNISVDVGNKPSTMGIDGAQASKDYKLFTPIASRTRNSSSRKPSKRILSVFDDSGDKTNEQAEVDMLVGRSSGSKELAAESSGRKSSETYDGHAKKGKTICEKTDLLNHCKGRRTRRKFSGHLESAANLDRPSTLAEGERVNEQPVRRKKRSKLVAKSTSSCLDMKREKLLTNKSSIKQDMVETGLADATVDCSLAVVNSKLVPKYRVKNSTPDGKKHNAQSVSYTEGREESVRSESRRERIQLSGSACVTPVNCASRGNPVSPVCIGDDNQIQSCKKSLSKSSLLRELVNLDTHETIRTPTLKEFRKRKDMASTRVLLSNHLDEDIIKQQKKILGRLGASVASSASEATHFVADKFVRTRNMLEAISHGRPVVTHLWLESCGQASCFIDEKSYILRDVKKEKEMGFSMPVSLAKACRSSLLQGKRVVVTPNVKPSKDVVVSLVRAVQGQAVERIGRSVMKDEEVPDDLLVLSCEEGYGVCVPFLEKGAMVYSSELLLNGIVIQKLEYARHRLFTNHVKRTRSTIWLKKDENFFPVTKRRSLKTLSSSGECA